MAKVFSLLLLIGFMISKLYAAHNPVTADILGKFAAELELNQVLIRHLENQKDNSLLGPLIQLRAALQGFEGAFYQRDLMIRFCVDPMSMTRPYDILSSAYRKDLAKPFYEGYDFKLLDLEGLVVDSVSINTLKDLNKLGIHDKVIEMVKQGRLHFKSDFKFGYVASVKSDTMKIVINQMRSELIKIFNHRIDNTTQFSYITRNYIISPANIGTIESILTLELAKLVYIYLPFIKFTRK